MSKQRTAKTEYRVYYGTDRNAALKPQYIPQPQRKKQTKQPKRQSASQAKAARKAEVARCIALVMLVVCVSAMGILVVSRNAEIYSNNMQIRTLANEKTNLEIQLNTAEKDASVGSELNAYFEIAQNELNMCYPEQSDIVTVTCPATVDADEGTNESASVNIYDTVLDWVGSLVRRIKSWA